MAGDKYIGDWLKGEMHGDGIKSQSDGSVLEGNNEWEERTTDQRIK